MVRPCSPFLIIQEWFSVSGSLVLCVPPCLFPSCFFFCLHIFPFSFGIVLFLPLCLLVSLSLGLLLSPFISVLISVSLSLLQSLHLCVTLFLSLFLSVALFVLQPLSLWVFPGCGSFSNNSFSVPSYFLLSLSFIWKYTSLCHLPGPTSSQWFTSAWWNGVACTTRKTDSSLLAFSPPSWSLPAVRAGHRDGMRRGMCICACVCTCVRVCVWERERACVFWGKLAGGMEWPSDLIHSWCLTQVPRGYLWRLLVRFEFEAWPHPRRDQERQTGSLIYGRYPSYLLTAVFDVYI